MIGAAAIAEDPRVLLASRFAATSQDVRKQVASASVLLDGTTVDPDRFNDMLLVLAEVLNNIVEHGIGKIEGGEIRLLILQSASSLQIETRDNGPPLPPTLLGDQRPPAIDVSVPDLPEGGFGWFMIHSLADDMIYERKSGENILNFAFMLD